jgi:dUTPase
MSPPYTYLRIAPRNGLARKGIDVGAGVVDADY